MPAAMTREGALVAIVGATVVPVHGPTAVRDATVVVDGERLLAVGPRAEVPVPASARVVDGSGRFLVPGLVDMHVHIGGPALRHEPGSPEYTRLAVEAGDDLELYLANGVTLVRNMWGAPFHRVLDAEVADGRRAGPRVRSVSAILDGVPPVWPRSTQITSEAAARAVVESIARDGYEAIKVYNHLDAQAYFALVVEGRRRGLPIVGHVPFAVGIRGALAVGQRSIEHFRGYDFDPDRPPGTSGVADRFARWLDLDDAALDRLVSATLACNTWNCPTLAVVDATVATATCGLDALPPQMRFVPRGLRAAMHAAVAKPIFTRDVCLTLGAGRPRQLALLKRLHEAGAGLLAGTDAGLPGVLPGFSLHDELALFVAAGLTPLDALACCCRGPASFYGDDAIGRLAPGGYADLILLDADPRRDIGNTRRIAAVVARGRVFERAALDRSLEDLSVRHAGIGVA